MAFGRLFATLVGLAAGLAVAQAPILQPAAPSALPVQPVAPLPAPPIPAGRWTPAQVQQAFELADSDSNGVLSRAEAQQLRILPRSFEELDQNKDGELSRDEYVQGTR